jgi:maltooligosyltrehalose trehalohydrolase
VRIEPEGGGDAARHPLAGEGGGVYGATVADLGAGARYRFALDGGDPFPDPYARSQPDGVHGASEVIDPTGFAWTDEGWPGLSADGLVVYECHVGTMTAEGTFAALERELPELARLGVTAVELMPVAQCPGDRNWGYDGVALYAPSHAYGRPDDLRRLVDAAHRAGLGVLLDAVYNHLGPDGNYLRVYATDYFTDRHKTLWGDALNYDGPNSRFVRAYAVENACHWLREYHVDGLRLDATDAIEDESPTHVIAELTARARAEVAPRRVVVIAEDARSEVARIRPVARGGEGLDGVWADDFHHQVRVHLTGERDGYYAAYDGTTASIAKAVNEGFVFQGGASPGHGGAPRGTRVTDEPARAFVFCIQNHDQIGNRAFGERLNHDLDAARYHAASALLLLVPETPLLFMGQEFRASSPFLYFTDHEPELGRLVTEGRRREFGGFARFADPAVREAIPDPQAESTFLASKLDLGERAAHADSYALYRELLRLRRADPVLRVQDRARTRATPLGEELLAVHRWSRADHRLLLVNFGKSETIALGDVPGGDALPAAGSVMFSTAEGRFGGDGTETELVGDGQGRTARIPARTAVLLGFGATAGVARG